MSIKIGDIDVANEIVELHFQIIRTQLILEHILKNNALISQSLNFETMQSIDKKAIEALQNKFPSMGIQKKQ